MALLRTMAQIVERGFRRADKENDDHIEAAERKALVGEVYNEIHSIVCETGCRHFETEVTIALSGMTAFELPADYLSTVSIEFVLDTAGRRRPLIGPIPPQHQHRYAGQTGDAYYYALSSSLVVLLPTPSTGTYEHRYIPQPTDYSEAEDSDSLDLLCTDGESFMYWSLACVAKDKSEADLRYAESRRQRFMERLQMWAQNRVITENQHAVVENDDFTRRRPGDWGDWYP